jgi:hypothetical protein
MSIYDPNAGVLLSLSWRERVPWITYLYLGIFNFELKNPWPLAEECGEMFTPD